MNKLLFLLLELFAFSVSASAQNLAVAYNYVYTSTKDADRRIDVNYTLISDGARSMFYNPDKWMVDSLNSTPEGKAALLQQAMALMASGQAMKAQPGGAYVCGNGDGTITSYHDEAMIGKMKFTEPIEAIDWQLTDSTKNILGYECLQAVGEFHGRHWTAWFAPDIAMQAGPWKLQGLPGLILEAEADGGVYSFTATAICLTDESIPSIIGPDQYETTTRLKFLREKRDFADHAMERMKARFGPSFSVTNPDGTPVTRINVPRDVVDFIETDY